MKKERMEGEEREMKVKKRRYTRKMKQAERKKGDEELKADGEREKRR